MSTITFHENPIHTVGSLPDTGLSAPDFDLVASDLSEKKLGDFRGKKLVLNIFPSIDTGVCATSVRRFNAEASQLDNTAVLCISNDLPFAQSRFCGAEGLNNVINLSAFRSSFGKDYGLTITDSPLKGLLSRAVITVNEEGKIMHTEQVPEIAQEPNYQAAIDSLK